MATQSEDQAQRDEEARRTAPKQQQPQQNQSGRGSETARTAGSNQDDTQSQQPGGVSREELGLPEWQEDEAMKERQRVDIQADEDALTEDEPQPSS